VVRLTEVKENGDVAFDDENLDDYRTETVVHEPTVPRPRAHARRRGHRRRRGRAAKQTGGPTIFAVADASGVVSCAAFEEAGVRAYPEVEVGDMVHVSGTVETRENALQLEVDSLKRLPEGRAAEARERFEAALDERARRPPADVDPLVEWEAFEPIHDDLRELARLLRRTVLAGRPIRVRHHADGDGMCAAIPVQLALENFVCDVHEDPDAAQHLFKRLPSKAPPYEMEEDVTRDLNFALEGRARHGQKLPFLLMLDNGSTEEDVPAYENLAHYDIPIAVVDHHHPDPEAVEPLLDAHVNPYLHDEDYRVTTGMMCVELARLIDPSITGELEHVPAVAGLSDRSKAETMDDYVALAEGAGYDESDLLDIGEALDYAAHWLRYSEGRPSSTTPLNVGCEDEARHEELVEFLSERADRDVQRQLDAVDDHVEHERLASGAHLYRIDLDEYAHRFTYPAPGNDRRASSTTLASKPVTPRHHHRLRSRFLRASLRWRSARHPEHGDRTERGTSRSGRLGRRSPRRRFDQVREGRRSAVIETLVEKMADAEIDEALSSTVAIDD